MSALGVFDGKVCMAMHQTVVGLFAAIAILSANSMCVGDGEVIVANHLIARARCAPEGMSISQRVAKVDMRIVNIISYENLQPPDIHIEDEGGIPAIYVGKYLFMYVYPGDAEPNGCTPQQLAQMWAKNATEWLPESQPYLTQAQFAADNPPPRQPPQPTPAAATVAVPTPPPEPPPSPEPEPEPQVAAPAPEPDTPEPEAPEVPAAPEAPRADPEEPAQEPAKMEFGFGGDLADDWEQLAGNWQVANGNLALSAIVPGRANLILLPPIEDGWHEVEFDVELDGSGEQLDVVVYMLTDATDAENYVALMIRCRTSGDGKPARLLSTCWNFRMSGQSGKTPIDLRETGTDLEDGRLHIFVRNSPAGLIARVGDLSPTGCRAEVSLGGRIGMGVRVLDADYAGDRPLPSFGDVIVR